MRTLFDYHIHPDYSIDASGTIRQYCDRALEIGLGGLCFTTHYDANPGRIERDGYWRYRGKRVRFDDELIAIYVAEVRKAAGLFVKFGLQVHCGLEIDYFPGVEEEARRLRDKFDLAFVIGSVHCLDNIAISDDKEAPAYFSVKSLGQMADDYFSLLRLAASCDPFDCIGHLDYYVRYGREYYGDDVDNIETERFDEVFDLLKQNGIGMEINCSQYRFGVNRFHPAENIIRRAAAAGVTITSVGSDAHRPAQLGLGIAQAQILLDELGIKPLYGGAPAKGRDCAPASPDNSTRNDETP